MTIQDLKKEIYESIKKFHSGTGVRAEKIYIPTSVYYESQETPSKGIYIEFAKE